MLYTEQTFAPPAFHSELQQQNKHSQHQGGWSTHRKARLEPAIRDAQKLAQNVFPPWRGDHVNSVPDLAASPQTLPPAEFIKTKMLLCCTGSGIDFIRILRLRFSLIKQVIKYILYIVSVSFSSICSCQRVLECMWKRHTEEYPAAKLLNWLNTRFE